MTTNQKLWSKTILSSYNYLEKLCDSLDKLIKDIAVNSYYSYGYKNGETSITKVSNKIINLTNRKINYINLKVLTDKALKNMPIKQAKLLILKFVNKLNIEKICELLKMSKRTAYRRIEQALCEFMDMLIEYGYTPEKLEIVYSNDPFIKSILKLVERNNFLIEEKATVITNESVFSRYITDLMAVIV